MSDIVPVVDADSMVRMQTRAPELLQQIRGATVLDDASYLDICNAKLAADEILKTITAITTNIKQKHKDALESALTPWERIAAPLVEAKALAEQKRKAYKVTAETAQAALEQVEQQATLRRLTEETLANALALADTHPAVADALLNTPVEVPPVQFGRAVPKVKGIVDRKGWKVEVTSKLVALEAIVRAAHSGTTDILEGADINLPHFRKKATQQRTAFAFPGIKAWQE